MHVCAGWWVGGVCCSWGVCCVAGQWRMAQVGGWIGAGGDSGGRAVDERVGDAAAGPWTPAGDELCVGGWGGDRFSDPSAIGSLFSREEEHATATTKAKATAGVLRCAQNDKLFSFGEEERGVLSSSLWYQADWSRWLEADAEGDRDETGFCAVLGEDVEAVPVCIAEGKLAGRVEGGDGAPFDGEPFFWQAGEFLRKG